jgi:hypothetical protein
MIGGITTEHLHSDNLPWVPAGTDGMDMRLLQYRLEDDFAALQLRAQPHVVSVLHRHLGPVYALTTSGRWGHDETYEYRPGTYVYEPVGVVHRFYSGRESVEACFIGFGGLEYFEPGESEPTGMLTTREQIDAYFTGCEAAGLPRPNVLQ